MQSLSEKITICGDVTNEYTGVYTKHPTSENRYTMGEFSEGTARELIFNSENKMWVLMEPVYRGATGGMGRYHTTKGFDLFGAQWKFSKNGPVVSHSHLPGNVQSNEDDWEEAPLSMVAIEGEMECPYFHAENSIANEPIIPQVLHLCGQNCHACPEAFGRYELQPVTEGSNGVPYYLFVGELAETNPITWVIYYDQPNNQWIISYGLG